MKSQLNIIADQCSQTATTGPHLLLGTAAQKPAQCTPTPEGKTANRFDTSIPSQAIHYDPRKDALVFIWDDRDGKAIVPELHLDPHPIDGSVKIVRVNGRRVTEIHGDPQLAADDIVLLPLSAAERVGLTSR